MSIEQKLNYIKYALEMGAEVELHFFDVPDHKEAVALAENLSELADVPFADKEREGSKWVQVPNRSNGMNTVIFYGKEEEEIA